MPSVPSVQQRDAAGARVAASTALQVPDWARVRRLLVVRLDNLGDVVLATPALRALRRALPEAHLTLAASPAGAALQPLLPWVDEVLVERTVWQDADGSLPLDPARELGLVDRLRSGRFDAVVALTSFSQSPWPLASLAYLAGIPVRVGISAEMGGSLLSHWVRDDQVVWAGEHQADRGLRLLAAVGIPAAGRHLELSLPVQRPAAGLGLDRPIAVVAPGASCPSRRWPAAAFGRVAAGLAAEGLAPVVVGTTAERPLVAAVLAAAGGAATGLAGQLDAPGLAALIADAALVVTNNSGCLHLADATRTPVVALFAGTERQSEYAARTVPAALLTRLVGCSPCRAFACPYGHECLDISPAEVLDAARQLLPHLLAGVA